MAREINQVTLDEINAAIRALWQKMKEMDERIRVIESALVSQT